MDSFLGKWLTGVATSVAAVALVGVFVLLRSLSVSAAVQEKSLEQYINVESARHEQFSAEIQSNTSRVTLVERHVAVLQSEQSYYSGRD